MVNRDTVKERLLRRQSSITAKISNLKEELEEVAYLLKDLNRKRHPGRPKEAMKQMAEDRWENEGDQAK